MDRSVIADIPRDNMPNGVSNALSIILIGAISKARFPHL
jgi:hypothetical protein